MKHLALPLMAALAIFASCSKERSTQYDISYRISFEPGEHYIDVRMHYAPSKPAKDKVAFKMPVWAPGYYLIMDYPKYLSDFEVNDASGKPVKWEKSGKNCWIIDRTDTLDIHYRVFADAMSVADSRVTSEGAFVAPNGVFLHKDVGHPVSVAIDLPDGWNKISTSLPLRGGAYEAVDFDVLYDSPFLIGNHLTRFIEQDGAVYEFAVQSPEGFEESPIAKDFLAGVREAVKIFRETSGANLPVLLLRDIARKDQLVRHQ